MSDPASGLLLEKRKLREKLRFRRQHFARNLDGMARLAAFRVLPDRLTEWTHGRDVAGYAAQGAEPDILSLLESFAASGLLALPHHAARDPHMDFRRWRPGDMLESGPWRTPQPADGAEHMAPEVIFCPLLGFDRQGGRIGQGGGHYDRYFAAHPDPLRIGVGWSVQEIDLVPVEATDIRLDAILTEQELILCGDRM